MIRCAKAAILLLAIAAPSALAQQQDADIINPAARAVAMAAKLPLYDVVSIRENKTGHDVSLDTTDDGVLVENASLSEIVQFAYNLGNADLISGISGPLDSAHFDIKAKIAARGGSKPAKFTDEQLQAMLIPVLADRFHLRVRLVPKVMSVFEIVVAKGGPKFKLAQPQTNSGAININASFIGDDSALTATKASMTDLADVLSESSLHRIVVDHTGLKGVADFTLEWSSDEAFEQGGHDLVTIFAAMQDQLGLKLQPAKLLVDTLVIDHTEMPTEN